MKKSELKIGDKLVALTKNGSSYIEILEMGDNFFNAKIIFTHIKNGDFDYTPDIATFTFTSTYDIIDHFKYENPIYGAVEIDNPLLDYLFK